METNQFPDYIKGDKKPYVTPELIELGDVADLTHVISVIVNG